ncbi:MAG TPA: sugar phosphate isomerase/epimerase [Verrucomicrobiae bacterium]|nr:sugar phosphate isomerase/epimerase [Verrucomicrobiae bacterium]
MKNNTASTILSRRNFLQRGLLGSAGLAAAATLPGEGQAAVTKAEREPWDGLKVGITSYTLRKLTLDDALAKTKQAGIKYISLKDFHLPLNSTAAQRQEAHQKVEAAGLVLMGGGVIYMKNNQDEIRHVFDYARDAGMPTIICSPDPDALDTVEKFAKQYGIRIAIHNHGPTDKKYPSPLDVLRLIKERDPLMGICMDVGHTVRIGEDPVEVMQKCAERLYDFHIKDVTSATPKGKPVEVGRGIIDIVAVLKTLVQLKYSYDVELEYEDKPDDPVPGMRESFGYIHGVLATI